MVTIKKMPKETLGELVAFLADNEPFSSIETKLGDAMSICDVRCVLKELAVELKREAVSESDQVDGVHKGADISKKTKEILSCLSSYEEKKLLKAFGFVEG